MLLVSRSLATKLNKSLGEYFLCIKTGTHGATNRCNTSQQQISSCEQGEFYRKFCRRDRILSPRQNFVAATCRTKLNWFNFVRHVAATIFCRGCKILIDLLPNVEVFTVGYLSLQPIAAMSAYDLSLDCTHKAMYCSNVLQRFVASCVPTLRKRSDYQVKIHIIMPFWQSLHLT